MLFFSCRGELDSKANKGNVVPFSAHVFDLGLIPTSKYLVYLDAQLVGRGTHAAFLRFFYSYI